MTKLMEGKRGLIFGLSNKMGMAWGISEMLRKEGAELACSYLPIMEKRVKPLAEELGAEICMPADIQDSDSLDAFFKAVEEKWGKVDFMLHAVAFSDKSELREGITTTTRENFKNTLDISAFSYIDLCTRVAPLMKDGGACATLTYLGGERVMPHYNVMGVAKAALDCSTKYLADELGAKGIRVNAISAGPIKTLAASGIGDFRLMLKWNEFNAPLKRNMTMEDVSRAGLYMLSDLSSGVTGEIHHVDCGYNLTAMVNPKQADNTATLLREYADNKKDTEEA